MTLVSSASLKKTLFYCLLVLLIAFTVEVTNQIIYYIGYGHFVWSPVERFNIRSFTQPVADARFVTIRPNFSTTIDEGWGVSPWSLSTDAWGFRKGTQSTEPACRSVVFIGASVPFGWGVSDAASLPSKVFNYLRANGDLRCVINAAVPSYTLFQAVSRYEHEIHGKIKTRVVFLQVYDPVSQLLVLGTHWQPEANWTNESAYTPSGPFVRFSASAAIVKTVLQRFGWMASNSNVEIFSPGDTATAERFRRTLRSELERLHAILVEDGVQRLIIGSLSVPRKSWNAPWFSDARRFAINLQNDEFRRFTAAHRDTDYVDTAELLSKKSDQDVFVDTCCHLSETGNDIVAKYIVQLLEKYNDSAHSPSIPKAAESASPTATTIELKHGP